MFLPVLNTAEKVAFVNLLYNAAKVDGHFGQNEQEHIDAYITEMGLTGGQTTDMSYKTETVLELFSKSSFQAKKIVYTELMALIFADGKFSTEEKKFVKQVQISLGISDDFCSDAQKWVQKIIPLYKEGFKLVELI